MKVTPNLFAASIAGLLAGGVMPALWPRLSGDSLSLVAAFLIVVALPAHAFVVGFSRDRPVEPGTLDTALLKRIGAWFSAAVLAVVVTQAVA